MLYSPEQEARFFLIWCHGTAEDIGTRHMTFVTLSRQLQTHILVFEYPSYGLSNGVVSSPSEASINDRAQRVYLFICHTIKWPTDRIIIYGHSLGSGPACHLASTQSVGGLILQSPYTSIKNLVREAVGSYSNLLWVSYWDNNEAMQHITCPTLFIHGQRDGLIRFEHSQILFNLFNHTNQKELVLLPNDDHNSISITVILMHTKAFLNKYFQSITEPMPEVNINQGFRQPY
ncbi:unnamed protein product [Rotaria sp. Silwood2]|nr:unnamed protein product [Rotaria sp. Silwood2]